MTLKDAFKSPKLPAVEPKKAPLNKAKLKKVAKFMKPKFKDGEVS